MKITILLISIFIFTIVSCQNADNSDQGKELSIEDLTLLIEKNPDQVDLLNKRAQLYVQKSDLNMAVADLTKATNLSPDSISYYMQMAELFMKMGQMNNTLGILKKVTEIAPRHIPAWIKLGEIHLMYKKREEVFIFANKALEIDPYNDEAFFLRAYNYKEMGDTNKSIENFQQCLKNNPQNYEANIELGNMFSALRNELAIIYYKNAIQIDSTNIDAIYNLGLFFQNNDMLNEAINTYKHLNDIDPKFAYSYYNIGYIYLQLLNISDKAVPYFTDAIKVKPDYYEAYLNRGLAFEKLGDVFSAKQDYQSALQINPDYMKAIESLNRVESNMK